MKKETYEKPSMKVYLLQSRTSLLMIVSGVDPNSSFKWGSPDGDR